MNQEILQKLGIKISEMSCNSLKRIYSSQIQEWTNTSGKDAAAFISDLVDERLISCKYDFQCECGNHCTAYVRKIERSSYKCPVCERSYSKDAIHKIGTLLFEVDKTSILEYCEEGNVDKNIRENIKVVPMTKRGDNDKMEIFIGSSSEAADYMDQISLILEGFVEAVRKRANGFDVDEEVEVYIPCRGENGCPSSIEDLVNDAKWKKEQIEKLADVLEGLNRPIPAEKKAILRVVVNYAGTQFFTKEDDGCFKQHESLESARDYIIHEYGADVEIETETDVRFSY